MMTVEVLGLSYEWTLTDTITLWTNIFATDNLDIWMATVESDMLLIGDGYAMYSPVSYEIITK